MTPRELGTRIATTTAAIKMFEEAVQGFKADPNLHPKIVEAQLAGMQGQLSDLREEHQELLGELLSSNYLDRIEATTSRLDEATEMLQEILDGILNEQTRGFTLGHIERLRLFLNAPPIPASGTSL